MDLGVITISWQTSEPTASIAYYGTNLTFGLALTNAALTTTHSIRLGGLAPGQTGNPFSPGAAATLGRWRDGVPIRLGAAPETLAGTIELHP